MQIYDAKKRAIEVQVILSASNSDKLVRLRMDVREQIVQWLQKKGNHTPRLHVEASVTS